MSEIVKRLRAEGETVESLKAKGHWTSADLLEQADTITRLEGEVERLRARDTDLTLEGLAQFRLADITHLEAVRTAASALIADVKRRYPGEELRCEYMRALDAALTQEPQP